MKYLLIIATLILSGCTKSIGPDISAYNCTDKQMEKVQKETLFCKTYTSFMSSFCYSSAIKRNCAFSK